MQLSVTDTGSGMDAETRARIFEPFFTTKAVDKGTGLGLATVYGVVKQSGGEIWVYSEPGQGTSFKLFFPRRDEEEPRDTTRPKTQASRGGETILVVDDEDTLRVLIARMLEKAGYVVMRASDGPAALRLAASHPGLIDLIVTDLMMPGMKGPDMVNEIRQQRPGVQVLYLSGYTEATVMREGLLAEGENFLQKPFAAETLMQRVREILDRPDAAR